uniref:Uncharacterized protein n=1 Tax=Branchiostoma floridae TaxID=7739 RepID=C3ZAX8_BRAFL|eukprot:XP_002594004.1 hypothetical protein BRAFLDRAFT_68557 [Branchiostoma floridae]
MPRAMSELDTTNPTCDLTPCRGVGVEGMNKRAPPRLPPDITAQEQQPVSLSEAPSPSSPFRATRKGQLMKTVQPGQAPASAAGRAHEDAKDESGLYMSVGLFESGYRTRERQCESQQRTSFIAPAQKTCREKATSLPGQGHENAGGRLATTRCGAAAQARDGSSYSPGYCIRDTRYHASDTQTRGLKPRTKKQDGYSHSIAVTEITICIHPLPGNSTNASIQCGGPLQI